MPRLINVFPLSIYRERIELPESYRQSLVTRVLEMEAAARVEKPDHSAWLGDTSGHEFLFQRPEFGRLFHEVASHVRAFVTALGLNAEMISLYFQRAWATVTRHGERISEHAHEQSNISVAYYLQKPAGSGGISFITTDHPNEFSRGMFSPAKAALGFIAQPGIATWNTVYLEPHEGDIVIFPSKTRHATVPNESGQERISISADITTMLRESSGHETMMPHISQWRSFEDELFGGIA